MMYGVWGVLESWSILHLKRKPPQCLTCLIHPKIRFFLHREGSFACCLKFLQEYALICVSAFWSQSNRSAHASVSGRVTLTESEQEIAFISDFVRVFDMSLQQYLPIITNESEHRFINPQAKEPTLSKNILIFGWIRHVPCWGGLLF